MKNLELNLRTLLVLLVTVLTIQHAQLVSIKDILTIYIICIGVTIFNIYLFKLLGLTEDK